MSRTTSAVSQPLGSASAAPLPGNLRRVGVQRTGAGDREVLLMHIEELAKLLRAKGAKKIEKIEEAARHPKKTAAEGLNFVGEHYDELSLAVKSALSNTFREVAFERMTLKFYKGVLHVNIKGRPGLRKILNAPKYRADNVKLRDLAIGETNVLERVKSDVKGTVLTVVVVSVIDVAEAYLSDDETKKHDLPFAIAVDVAKTIVSALAGAAVIAGLVLAAGTLGVTIVGALPVILAIGAGAGIGWLLDHYLPTEKIAHAFHQWFDTAVKKAQVILQRAGHVIVEKAQVVKVIVKNEAAEVRQAFREVEWSILREVGRLHLY